jgi:hypothetical protein
MWNSRAMQALRSRTNKAQIEAFKSGAASQDIN